MREECALFIKYVTVLANFATPCMWTMPCISIHIIVMYVMYSHSINEEGMETEIQLGNSTSCLDNEGELSNCFSIYH